MNVESEISSLAPAEIDLAKLIIRGETNKSIAAFFHRSVRSIEVRRRELLRKLQLCSIRQLPGLMLRAEALGLVELGKPTANPRRALTDAEAEIVPLLCQGLSNVQIANRIEFSTRTVENRIRSVKEALGVCSPTEIVWWALSPDSQHALTDKAGVSAHHAAHNPAIPSPSSVAADRQRSQNE